MPFNFDADAKRKFRQRFRDGPSGLIFSRSPGGEGRPVFAQESRTFIADYDALIDRTGKQRGTIFRCLIIALLFHILGYAMRSIPLIMITVWTVYALGIWLIVTFIRRMRAKHANWHLVERRTIIPPLSGAEKIKRGYRIAFKDWLWIIPVAIVAEGLRIPARQFEEMFGNGELATVHHQTQAIVLTVGAIIIAPGALLLGALKLHHWWRTR
jgi:hypothetical protein